MKSLLSERVKGTGKSVIRETLKLTKKPEIISFAGGLPKPETFPYNSLAEASRKQIGENYSRSLQYVITEGVEEFREEVMKWFASFGWKFHLENIIATNSSQQAIDLVSKAFLDPGDVIFCGAPSYLGALQNFTLFQANTIGIPVDNDGINTTVLEEKVKQAQLEDKHTKFIYVVPDFQNPTGVTLSGHKRQRLVEIAEKYNLVVIEDTPYFGLRFAGTEEKPINTYDSHGRVITMSSMSKVLSSGMRLAVVVGPPKLLEVLVTVKQATDLCTSTTTQWIVTEWLRNHDMAEHLSGVRKHYKQNRDVMLDSLAKFFPDDEGISWTKPEGGLFIWVTLPKEIDTEELFHKAISENVAYVPGSGFYADDEVHSTMRLCYSLLSTEKIRTGIERLGKVIEKEMATVSHKS